MFYTLCNCVSNIDLATRSLHYLNPAWSTTHQYPQHHLNASNWGTMGMIWNLRRNSLFGTCFLRWSAAGCWAWRNGQIDCDSEGYPPQATVVSRLFCIISQPVFNAQRPPLQPQSRTKCNLTVTKTTTTTYLTFHTASQFRFLRKGFLAKDNGGAILRCSSLSF